mgnify:FL=1
MMIIINVGREEECALPHSLQATLPLIYLYVSYSKLLEQIVSALQMQELRPNVLFTYT